MPGRPRDWTFDHDASRDKAIAPLKLEPLPAPLPQRKPLNGRRQALLVCALPFINLNGYRGLRISKTIDLSNVDAIYRIKNAWQLIAGK